PIRFYQRFLLVYDNSKLQILVTKQLVLEIFAQNNNFIVPDQIWAELKRSLDRRSVYSYLLRLKRQGLLETRAKRRRLPGLPIDRARPCTPQLFPLPPRASSVVRAWPV